MPQTPLVGTHAYVCMSVLSHATIILLPSCSPLPHLKYLYETSHELAERAPILLLHKLFFQCTFTGGQQVCKLLNF